MDDCQFCGGTKVDSFTMLQLEEEIGLGEAIDGANQGEEIVEIEGDGALSGFEGGGNDC